MKEQLFLFTGENTYALTEELRRWQNAFISKHGEANFQILQGDDSTWSQLLNEVQSAPFLSEKRLVIVEGMPPAIEKEQLETLAKIIHPQTLLAFVDPKPDKRKGAVKFLLKEATVKSFPLQTPKQLTIWLKKLAQDHGGTLDEKVAAHLVAVVGSDQWHLKNECLKLLSYAGVTPSSPSPPAGGRGRIEGPTTDDVDHIAIPSEKHTVWKMSDLIGRGDAVGAVRFASLLKDQGEDAFALWNIYLWIMKNLATLWIYANDGRVTPSSPERVPPERDESRGGSRGGSFNIASLVKESGVPFGSAQSLLPLVKKMKKEKIQRLVASAVEADEALKTGALKATAGEQGELMAVLEGQLLALK